MKQEELQNNRKDYEYGCKKVSVVDSHNYVLPIWAEYCAKEKIEYRLITLDYHADTMPCYNRYSFNMQSINASVDHNEEKERIYNRYVKEPYNIKNIEEMTAKYVYHDEHIMTAWNLGYLSEIFCICKEKDVISKGIEHYLVMNSKTTKEDLFEFCKEATKERYILDIDLDYFTSKSVFEVIKWMIIELIKDAEIITIAREKRYFDYCKDKTETEWTNEIALKSTLELIEKICTTREQC